MKEIPLTRGYIALVDDKDYEWLSKYSWSADSYGRAQASIGGKTVKMSRVIMGVTDPKVQVDHEDGCKQNNQRYNLRIATNIQNSRNQHKKRNPKGPASSQYKGFYFSKSKQIWEAYISPDRKHIYLGTFDSELLAAQAYDRAAVKYYGEFAHTNFPELEEEPKPRIKRSRGAIINGD